MDYSWETISIIDTRPSSENKFTVSLSNYEKKKSIILIFL